MLQGRPWLFDFLLFSFKNFDGCTPPSKMEFSTKVFWVQTHDLPIACMNETIGGEIGSTIGKEQFNVWVDGIGWRKTP